MKENVVKLEKRDRSILSGMIALIVGACLLIGAVESDGSESLAWPTLFVVPSILWIYWSVTTTGRK